MLWLGLGAFARPSIAQAEPSTSEHGIVAGYSADPGCPDRAQFEQRVRARLADAEAGGSGRRFEVRFWREGAGARGRLQLVGHETAQARELSAASCAEAADALALVAALMLQDPAQPRAERALPDEQGVVHAAPSPGRSRAARGVTRAAQPEVRAGTPSSDPSAGSEQVSVSPDTAANAHVAQASARENGGDRAPNSRSGKAQEPSAPSALATPRAPFFSAPRLALFAAGFAAWRVAPHVRPGLGLGLALSARAGRGPRLGALLGVRATLPDLKRNADGRAQFVWAAGTGALCIEGPERRLRAAACAVLELGAIRASGAAATGHGQTRFWGALGPSLAAMVAVHERVGLRLSGELLGILVRDRFLLAERVVYSVPRLAFRSELAVWITIW